MHFRKPRFWFAKERTAGARPLTLDEASVALTMALENGLLDSHAALKSKMRPSGRFKNIVNHSCGLILCVHDSKLSFIHQTAREFLIHRERKGNWQGRFDQTRSHAKMSLICLEYYLSYTDGQKSVDDIMVDCPLAEYSAKSWIGHIKHAETEKDVQEKVPKLFPSAKANVPSLGQAFRH